MYQSVENPRYARPQREIESAFRDRVVVDDNNIDTEKHM